MSFLNRIPAPVTQVGKALLPLRLFMGVTFVYAGLLKLVSPDYLNADSPNGVLKQMQVAAAHSPISFVLNHAIEHATLAGIAIAVGELFAGLGLLVGIWTRFAALGAFVLSLSFFLTVSWGTYPYFFGPDIVFMAGLLPLVVAGDGGLWSVEAVVRKRLYSAVQGKASRQKRANIEVSSQGIERRVLVQSGFIAGGLGAVGVLAGVVGRTMNHAAPSASSSPSTTPSAKPTHSSSASVPPVNGTKIATISDVPVGTAYQFADPATGLPAYLLQPAKGRFLAYSALCTHEGCQVGFAGNQFQCPCHGAQFDAITGAATRGPAQEPLAPLRVVASGNDIYIV